MQPLLRRLAHGIQNAHDFEGPVFWRPYGSQPCLDPSHARNAIVYTHLNPVQAGLCDDPSGYPWTSHALYAGATASELPREIGRLAEVVDPLAALPLFATGPEHSRAQLHDDYRAFVAWRLEMEPHVEDQDEPPRPPVPWRRYAWGPELSPLFDPGKPMHRDNGRPAFASRPHRPDMAAIGKATLAAEAPGVPLHSIRGRGGGPHAVRLRHAIIRRLHLAGFRHVDIARFIGLSESGVSYVLRKPRGQA